MRERPRPRRASHRGRRPDRVRRSRSRRQRAAALRGRLAAAGGLRHRADRRPPLPRRARGRSARHDPGRGRARSRAPGPGVGGLAGDRRRRRRRSERRRRDEGRLPGVPPPVRRRLRAGRRGGRIDSAGRRARALHGRKGPNGARLRAAAAGRRRLGRARCRRLRGERAQPPATLAGVVRRGRRRARAAAAPAHCGNPGCGNGGSLERAAEARRSTCSTRASRAPSSTPFESACAGERARDLRSDGVGQDGRRRGGRRADLRRDRLGGLDAGLPRAADPDEPGRRRASSASGRPTTSGRWASTSGSPTPRSTRAWPTAARRSSSAAPASISAPRSPSWSCRPCRGGRRARVGSAFYDAAAASGSRHLRERDAGCRRAVHPNDRQRVVRALELAEAGASLVPSVDPPLGRTRRATRRWSSGSRCRRTCSSARIVARAHEMFERGVEEEVRAARAAAVGDRAQDAGPRGGRAGCRASEASEALDRAHPPVRGISAQVDAPYPGRRYGRCRGALGGDGGCGSRSGTRSATATCCSRSELGRPLETACAPALRPPLRRSGRTASSILEPTAHRVGSRSGTPTARARSSPATGRGSRQRGSRGATARRVSIVGRRADVFGAVT